MTNSILSENSVQQLIEQWLQQEKDGVKFPVDFDVAWKIAGYSRKDSAKRALINYLIEGEEFSTQRGKLGTVGRSTELIKITCDALKELCMLSRSPQGKATRKYFIEAEKKWKLTQQHFPEVAQSVELVHLDKLIELEKLRYQNNSLDNTMLTLHGKSVVLALRGRNDQIVREEVVVTEVVNKKTGKSDRILSAEQLKKAVYERTGQKIKSLKQFTDALREAGRDDLLVAVERSSINQYPIPEKLDEAIDVVFAGMRQRLIGEYEIV